MTQNPIRVGNIWMFPDGKTLPVVAGGSGDFLNLPPAEGHPPADGEPPAVPGQNPDRPRNEKGQFTPAEQAAVDQKVEEVTPNVGDTNPHTGRTFTETEVEAIRREEKDKLYGQIEAMRSKIDTLAAAEEQRQQALADAEAEAQRQREEAERAEMSALERVTKLEEDFQRKQTELTQSIEAERAMFERERQLNQLDQYKTQRMAAEQENILPELIDWVRGSNEEEIEASISLAKEKTAAILANVQAAMGQAPPPQGQPPVQQQPAPGVGPQVTAPPVGPMDTQQNYQTVTADDIRNMTIEEYAKNRDRIHQGLRGHVQERGIYG